MIFFAPNSPGLSATFDYHLNENLLCKWYPLVIDEKCGGYFTNITHDWHLAPEQEKMIVSQARHLWTTSKAVAIYGLAALYARTHDPVALDLAKEAFEWLETHAHDPEYDGYFQFLTREGEPFDENSQYRSVASDIREVGLKDQNSAVHLLEAYTELYRVWKDNSLRARLASLLHMIRETMVTGEGYLRLFFTRDWTPLTFRTASEATRTLNYGLDHVSFGHDAKTAFLLLQASNALGIENDVRTLAVAKQLLNHTIENGWDPHCGGFFDGGYYPEGSNRCVIVKETKTWWVQAETLNTLLLFSYLFPDAACYLELFEKQWEYIDTYLLDHRNGDWFEGGLDKEPFHATGPKGHMWKCTYHTSRALMNCV